MQVFGEKPLYPPAAPRTDAPLAPVQAGQLDEEQLRREQKLLLDYARMAVTEENVDILARQALAARPSVSASTLADEYPNDFARIIGLHPTPSRRAAVMTSSSPASGPRGAASGLKNLL